MLLPVQSAVLRPVSRHDPALAGMLGLNALAVLVLAMRAAGASPDACAAGWLRLALALG